MPRILAFDTAAAHCAAALLDGERIVTRVDEMAKGQAEHLMPMLEEMLADAALTWRDLDAIGVGVGPGNFTGIRIAVSAARGLALGLGKPAVGVSTLEAQAHDRGDVTIVLPAPRDMAYVQTFGARADIPRMTSAAEAGIGAPLRPAADVIAAMARITATRMDRAERPAPLYLRPADAAPARDAAPVILT